MQHVIVYAPSSSTRKLYQKTLISREIEPYSAKTAADVFLQLSTFEIDTVIMVDEGNLYDLDILLTVLEKKYDDKRVILVSPEPEPRAAERYSNTQAFFDIL